MRISASASYYRARYYDSTTGRFVSEDPLQFGPGVNFYEYVGNSPTMYVDPRGLDANSIISLILRIFGPPVMVPMHIPLHCTTPSECNFTPDMQKALQHFQDCLGKQVNITCGNGAASGQHDSKDPHMKGMGVDIGFNSNPWLKRSDAENCFAESFPQGPGGSYAQEEYNRIDMTGGTHIHIQYTPGQGVAHGFQPGVKPHGKPKSKPCDTCDQ